MYSKHCISSKIMSAHAYTHVLSDSILIKIFYINYAFLNHTVFKINLIKSDQNKHLYLCFVYENMKNEQKQFPGDC